MKFFGLTKRKIYFDEFVREFNNEKIRIRFLESFLIYHYNQKRRFSWADDIKTTNEYFENMAARANFYKSILKVYWQYGLWMVNDIKQTKFFKRLSDKEKLGLLEDHSEASDDLRDEQLNWE